ncbi:MAG: POTRA domain-containing protein [Crocinitomicaceae bacterium]
MHLPLASPFRIFLFLLVVVYSISAKSENIHQLLFEGLTKTKESYLRGIVLSKEGTTFSEEKLKEDVQNLRNLNLFFSVNERHKWNETAEGWVVVFIIEEANYLYPVLSVSGFTAQLQFEVGVNQINFRGHAESLGIVYRYYDRHSISAFYSGFMHKNSKTGHFASITKYSTIEPLYFSDTVADFNFDNYNISLGGHYWWTYSLRTGLGGMYMYEIYEQIDSSFNLLDDRRYYFHKYQFRTFTEYSTLNQHFEFRWGFTDRLHLETVQAINFPEISYVKLANELSWFQRIGKRHNIGFRNRIGISTNIDSPFTPFVLDGFINVRGIGNRIARGTAEFVANFEYRYSFWRHKWFFIQSVVFSDFGTLRPPGGQLSDMISNAKDGLFIGGGLRFHSRFFYKTTFRIDYSFNPLQPNNHGLTFGFGQFF